MAIIPPGNLDNLPTIPTNVAEDMDRDVIDIRECAYRSSYSVDMIRKLVRDGKIPYVKLYGGHGSIRFIWSDVLTALRASTVNRRRRSQ